MFSGRTTTEISPPYDNVPGLDSPMKIGPHIGETICGKHFLIRYIEKSRRNDGIRVHMIPKYPYPSFILHAFISKLKRLNAKRMAHRA
jgi:hypothetical protein